MADALRAAAQPALRKLHAASDGETLRAIAEALYAWDVDTGRLDHSPDAAETLGLLHPDRLDSARLWATLLDPRAAETRETALARATDTGDPEYCIEYALHPDHISGGAPLWLEDRGRFTLDETGRPVMARGAVRVVNARRRAEERARRAALADGATGAANRPALDLAVADALARLSRPVPLAARAAQGATPVPQVFVLVALEGVETVNSVYGYAAGDALIVEAANRLRSAMRGDDLLARFSGSKFGLLLHDCSPADALVAARRFLRVLETGEVDTPAGPVAPDAAIASVCLQDAATETGPGREDGAQPRAVYTAAYQALDEARVGLRERIALFRDEPERQEQFREAARIAGRVTSALRDGRVHLAWQPVVDAGTHAVVFHEALIRMETDGGTWEAGRFIETAVRLNLVRRVDHYALDAAAEVLRDHADARFSINLSNDTASDPAWLHKLSAILEPRPDLAERLIVEVTESHAAHSLAGSRHFIGALHDLGARVALDDFGAGFTAFRHLKDLPFDIIKIDGQFCADLVASRENGEFIRSLVRLAKLFEAKTVVEWVEDYASAETLYEWGVDYLQGFFFGRAEDRIPWH